jgi:hypothetical protein
MLEPEFIFAKGDSFSSMSVAKNNNCDEAAALCITIFGYSQMHNNKILSCFNPKMIKKRNTQT